MNNFDELRAKRRTKSIAGFAFAISSLVIILYFGINRISQKLPVTNLVRTDESRRTANSNQSGEIRQADKNVYSRDASDKSEIVKFINITNFEAKDFEAAWAEAVRAGRTEVDQVYNLGLVVGRMSRIGNPTLVLDKILREFGPGRSRCHLVGTIFMESSRITDLKTVYERLEFPDELSSARGGIARNLAMLDSPALIDRSDYAFLGDRFDPLLRKSLELYVSKFLSKPPEQLSAAVAQALEAESTVEGKTDLISRLIKLAPFDCWEQISAAKISISPPDQKALFSLMFAKDATVAMERIAAVSGSEKYFPEALQLWLENDARKPIEWLENNKSNLSAAQKDRALQGIAEYSARHDDSETAGQWLKQIVDPKLREEAEKHLEEVNKAVKLRN